MHDAKAKMLFHREQAGTYLTTAWGKVIELSTIGGLQVCKTPSLSTP